MSERNVIIYTVIVIVTELRLFDFVLFDYKRASNLFWAKPLRSQLWSSAESFSDLYKQTPALLVVLSPVFFVSGLQ